MFIYKANNLVKWKEIKKIILNNEIEEYQTIEAPFLKFPKFSSLKFPKKNQKIPKNSVFFHIFLKINIKSK